MLRSYCCIDVKHGRFFDLDIIPNTDVSTASCIS